MKETNSQSGRKKDIKRKIRTCHVVGVLAGIATMAAILAAGYLSVNYFYLLHTGNEPTLPAQIIPAGPAESISAVEESSSDVEIASSEGFSEGTEEPSGEESSEETEKTTEEPSTQEPATEEKETQEPTEAEPVTEEEPTEKETLSEEEPTEKETLSEEEPTEKETLSEEEAADRALRMKAIEKFDNLGIVINVHNYLNMRTKPSTKADICGKIFSHCGVNILEEANSGWYRIESGGATGYVSKDYIATGDTAVKLALENCRYQAEVLPDTLDVLYSPEDGSGVITSVRQGERYDILSFKGAWAEIEAVEGLSGYVRVEDINAGYFLEEGIVFGYDESISQLRIDLINKAFEYYGGPYVWGGDSLTNGIDCSGFTEQIYAMFGITLHDVSWLQVENGVAVSEENIRPGDLLFYYGKYPDRVGHVAIYIGNGKILHAASESKGICVSSWKYVPIVAIRDVIGNR